MTKLKNRGFVPSKRRDNTGIGYTLEWWLGIKENNYSESDFIDNNRYKGAHFELKSQRYERFDPRKEKPRSKNQHLVSLVTQAPHGDMTNKELLTKFGYSDESGRKRKNLYATISATKSIKSKHEFVAKMKIKRQQDRLFLLVDNKQVAYVDLNKILGKLENLIIVRANSELRPCTCNDVHVHQDGYHEYFQYTTARVLTAFSKEKFYKSIDEGKTKYDLRMHEPEGKISGNEGYDTKHDHGTGFRTKFENVSEFYDKIDDII